MAPSLALDKQRGKQQLFWGVAAAALGGGTKGDRLAASSSAPQPLRDSPGTVRRARNNGMVAVRHPLLLRAWSEGAAQPSHSQNKTQAGPTNGAGWAGGQ